MKSHWFKDSKKGKRLTVSMTEKEAIKIYDALIGRNSFESHKLRRIIYEFERSEDVIMTGDCTGQGEER